jgi:hypothetical protein
MKSKDFTKQMQPNDSLVLDLDIQELAKKRILKTKDKLVGLQLVIGLSPSFVTYPDTQSYGYHSRTEKYVSQLVLDEKPISNIWVARSLKFPCNDSKLLRQSLRLERYFWNKRDLTPLPVVTDQFTEERYWGNGLNTALIHLSNKFYKRLFCQPLYSVDKFATMIDERDNKPAIVMGSRRAWEKLEELGFSSRFQWNGKPRWHCI